VYEEEIAMGEEQEIAMGDGDVSYDDEQAQRHPAGMLRLMPVVNFGMRAAALAGLVVSVGSVAAALSGLGHVNVMGEPDTTCCPGPL
jgi:hypothetical protein